LVLDDYHTVISKRVGDALFFFIENLPPNMHVVVSGRSDPPWPLARLRARGEMAEVRVDELRFTLEEAAAFLEAMDLGVPEEYVAALEARTEGWVAGLHMAALSMRGRSDLDGFVKAFSGSHRFVMDYLVEEVLEQQTAQVQEFLLRTSVLDRLNAALCDAVADVEISQDLLARFEQENLFLVPLDDERRWYRYHNLFAELLRSRLEESSPGEVFELHRRACEWYADAGLVEEAVGHALAGQNMEMAVELVEQNAMSMIAQGKLITLSRWLEALPFDLVRVRVLLAVFQAWTRYWIGSRTEGEESLREAQRALADMDPSVDRDEIAGHLAAVSAYYAITNEEETERVLEMSQQALELLPEDNYMYGMAALALGGAYWGLGQVEASEAAFVRSSVTAQRGGHKFLAVSGRVYAGIQQVKQARLRDAHRTFREALEMAGGPGDKRLPPAGFPLVRMGALHREWNELKAAEEMLTEGVRLCQKWGQADLLADGYIALARLKLAQWRLEEAVDVLRKAEDLARDTKVDPWVTCWLDDCRVRLWLARGSLTSASKWARSSSLSRDDELSYLHDLNHVNLARVWVAQAVQQSSDTHLGDAMVLLSRLLDAAEAAGWVDAMINVLVLQVQARQARGDAEGALLDLSRALLLAEPGGYVRVFVDEGAPMVELLRRAAAQGTAVEYVGRLLTALEAELGLDGRLRGLPDTVEPLSERELEVLRLLAVKLTRGEIAEELFISVNTVRSHIKSIYGKLDAHSREEAVERARALGLL
jgi:LuxR family maltose regulon positive regulatory protein